MSGHTQTSSAISRWIQPLLIGSAVGIVVCIGLLLAMAAGVNTVDIPRAAVLPLAIAAAAVGAFAAGLVTARITRRNGLLMGALDGILLFLLILVAGFVRYAGVDGGIALIKALVLTACGALGGVIGVNRKHR